MQAGESRGDTRRRTAGRLRRASPRLSSPVPPPPSQVADDRAPDSLADGVVEPLRSDLEQLLGADRVLHRVSDLVAYASDASPYRRFPRAVVEARDADDVAKTLRFGRERDIPVTFRAGGTSLNGQGQTDGILYGSRFGPAARRSRWRRWGAPRTSSSGSG